MNETYIAINLKNGVQKVYPHSTFVVEESNIPEDGIGGMAPLPICEIFVDGESVGFLDEPPRADVRYSVAEVRDEADLDMIVSLKIIPA